MTLYVCLYTSSVYEYRVAEKCSAFVGLLVVGLVLYLVVVVGSTVRVQGESVFEVE